MSQERVLEMNMIKKECAFQPIKLNQTSRKYHIAKIFVDHFSKWTDVHFSESTTANEAI